MVQLWSLGKGFPASLVVKNLPSNAVDMGSIPGLGRSPGGEHSNPLQYSFWETPWSMGLQRVRHSLVTREQQRLSYVCCTHRHCQEFSSAQ